MQKQSLYANPFALMMDPQAVLEAMERSERLNRLESRVCRPLDKPLIPMLHDDDVVGGRELTAATRGFRND
ncbi:MAG TPA: hypothetical protein VEQ09_07665 [Aquabacterium sp.]|nr:hypothetical protein [Aquabacterium sp.]